ncbi:MAG: hypothetical protein V3U26_03895 [Dehalococcoidia bacterium]
MWRHEGGVSTVLGTLIIFASLTALYASVQVSQVPLWNANEEQDHQFDVWGDMRSLKGVIEGVAATGTPRSAELRMGMRFSNRVIFFNPRKGVAGNLIREDVPISVQYTLDTPGTPTYVDLFTSTRLIYEVSGTIRSPKLVYEHGLVIQDWQTTSFTRDEQPLLTGDEMFIPWVTGEITIGSTVLRELINIKYHTEGLNRRKVLSATVTLGTNYPQVWQETLQDVSTSDTTASVFTSSVDCEVRDSENVVVFESENCVKFSSVVIRHIVVPAEGTEADVATTRTIYVGMIRLSTTVPPEEEVPTTTIDEYETTDFPAIFDISLVPEGQGQERATHSTIIATVRNTSAPYDIHADLNDLSRDPSKYDMVPDYSSPDDIMAQSWSQPNENEVRWTNILHQDYEIGQAIAITFWIYNTDLRQQFYTTRVFIRKSKGVPASWQ